MDSSQAAEISGKLADNLLVQIKLASKGNEEFYMNIILAMGIRFNTLALLIFEKSLSEIEARAEFNKYVKYAQKQFRQIYKEMQDETPGGPESA